MPNYEYRCLDCRRRFEIFLTYAEYGVKEVRCPYCQSAHVLRKIGKVRVARSLEGRLDAMADSGSMEDMEKDPRALGRMMRELSAESGEDMGETFNEVVGRLESGQDPEDIERDLPELGAEDGGMGGMPPGLGGMGGLGGLGGLDD